MTATAEIMTAGRLDFETLLELLRRTDPVGVLSIYVNVQPGADARAVSIDIKNRLWDLERGLESDGPAERARAVADAIARLLPEIERLIDGEEPGRGRVLFAAAGDRWSTRLSSQLPLPTRVVLDSSPFIHPLLELLDEGRPAGVVVASRNQARLLEWRTGELSPLKDMRLGVVEPPHERAGPVGSRPAKRHGTPTGEQRNARERHRSARFIASVAATASRLAAERGWERVIVSGGEHLTWPLVKALSPELRDHALRDHRLLVRSPLSDLAQLITERVRAGHDELELRLAREVRERAHGAGAAALGLSEVLAALNQARVAHLVYDPCIRYRGTVWQDGSLYAEGESRTAGVHSPDTRLTERIVERALETGARVTPVEGAARKDLADACGIGALLRW